MINNIFKAIITSIIVATTYVAGDPCRSNPCKEIARAECLKVNGFTKHCVIPECSGEICCDERLCCENGKCNQSSLNGTNGNKCGCFCDENYEGEIVLVQLIQKPMSEGVNE